MKVWLKGLGISVKVAVAALLMAMAVMAAQRHKATANKWRDKVLDIENDAVDTGIATAAAANSQAMLHDNRATEIKKKAEEHANSMGGKDEEVSNILDQFRNSS